MPGWEKPHAKTVAWSYDREGHAQKCVEIHCELAKKKTEHLYKVSSPCLDDHNFKKEELETVGELSDVCSQIVLNTCMWLELADLTFFEPYTSLLARSPNGHELVTDVQLVWYLIFITRMTIDNIVMWVIPLNTADEVCSKTQISLVTLKTRNQPQGVFFFGSRTFVRTSWMCKKQTSVSHCSAKSDIISLDAGLRTDYLLWTYGMGCGDRSVTFIEQYPIN